MISTMNFDEFEALYRDFRARHARSETEDFALFELVRADDDDFTLVEHRLGIRLPGTYKEFMRRYGAGLFGYVELIYVIAPSVDTYGLLDEIEEFDGSFLAVAPVGTGDFWGFVCREGVCEETVSFRFHDSPDIDAVAPGFLEFLAAKALHP